MQRRTFLIGATLIGALVALMVGAGVLSGAAKTDQAAAAEPSEASAPRPTETVKRSTLTETANTTGRVGFGAQWQAPIDAEGIVTKRHDKGTIVEPGEELIRINDKPITLANGTAPMYRTLEMVGTSKSKHLKGDDVRQLQEFLLTNDHDDSGRMEADGIFGTATRNAVKAWQKNVGLEETGKVDRTHIVFSDGPLRIDDEPRVGATFSGLQVTAGTPQVTGEFEAKQRAFVLEGATVTLDPDGEAVTGTIAGVESGVNDEGDQVVKFTVEVSRALPEGTEKVRIKATRTLATDVTVVPVRAVLALAGGGYGLEVKTSSGTELRRVELGDLVDDVVEVTGDIDEGDEVIVPNDQFGGGE
ncbi:MAG: peptidoglycan-binding protein [Actinomycetota bacterium]